MASWAKVSQSCRWEIDGRGEEGEHFTKCRDNARTTRLRTRSILHCISSRVTYCGRQGLGC